MWGLLDAPPPFSSSSCTSRVAFSPALVCLREDRHWPSHSASYLSSAVERRLYSLQTCRDSCVFGIQEKERCVQILCVCVCVWGGGGGGGECRCVNYVTDHRLHDGGVIPEDLHGPLHPSQQLPYPCHCSRHRRNIARQRGRTLQL